MDNEVRKHNVGTSNYAELKVQPWEVWIKNGINPFDADIIKRIMRQKFQFGKDAISSRIEDYEKIIHICQERINQLKTGECWEANIDMQSIEKIRKALKNREI